MNLENIVIDYKQFGDLIKMKRNIKGLTYGALSKITGIRPATLISYENRNVKIPMENWLKIKEVLGISDDDVKDLNKSVMEACKQMYSIK